MKLEKPTIHWKALDVLAHQIVGLTIDYGDIEKDRIYETIKKCYIYKDLSYEEFEEILDFLDQIRLIRYDRDKNIVSRTRKGFFYYIENLSMIPDEKSYEVFDITTKMKLGVLHEEFIAKHGNPGTVFILRGLPWKIEKIEKNRVYVSLEKDFESAIPSWEGELLPVPFEVAQEAQEIKKELINNIKELKDQKLFFIPDKNKIFIESFKDWYIIHAPFGSKTNDTLSRIIAHIISEKYGIIVGVKTDPYRIMLKAGYINKEIIKDVIENIPENFEDILKKAIINTDLFLWKFTHVAKRFGVIRKDADYSKSTIRRIANSLINTPVFKETLNELFTEKLDIEHTREIIRKIKSKEIEVIIINKSRPSPLAIIALENVVSDVVLSDKWKELLRLVKERLYNTEIYLICIACRSKYRIKVKEYKESFKCKKCGGTFFGVSKTEKVNKKMLETTAEFLKYYGKKFLLVYAGKGISIITARNILRKSIENEDDLIKEIIEKEKQYFKIRRFIK